MNDTILDPIHKPKPENPVKVDGSGVNKEELSGSSDDHGVISSKNGKNSGISNSNGSNSVVVKRERPVRACTARPPLYVDPSVFERRSRPSKKEKVVVEEEVVEEDSGSEEEDEVKGQNGQCKKVVTSLVNTPTYEQLPRWNLRAMWEFASILHFLHVFRPLLNMNVEFSAEELESALLTPNDTLGEVHIPLLKSVPPVTRMAYGQDNWVIVLCRKMRDWWQSVAVGELPIVSSQGAEIETYKKNLDPAVRVVILKALCDIRVEQDDIRSYIDNSIKHGVQLSVFRKARIGGDSHGISYWYEDDELIGHRLYREIRKVEKKVEANKGNTKGSHVLSSTSYEWETVATNLDEFLDVSEKLFTSENRTEVSLGKKLKNDMLPQIENMYKRKEKLLKKQQREALLLDNFVNMDGFGVGRSLRDRKPVTYTFDDYDRSIIEALKVTKPKQPSPGHRLGREVTKTEPSANGRWNDSSLGHRMKREVTKREPSANGRWNGSSHTSMHMSFTPLSPTEYDEMDEDRKSGPSDRSSRRRQKPQRYSEKEFVGTISDNEEYIYSDDDIVGEAVYYEADLKQRKQKNKVTSSSEGEVDDEYHWSDENGEDDVEDEKEDSEEDSMSGSDYSEQPRGRIKEREGRTRRGTKVDSGLRRSKRSTRTQINYQQYEYYDSETESLKRRRTNPSDMGSRDSDESDEEEHQGGQSGQSEESDESDEEEPRELGFGRSIPVAGEKDGNQPSSKSESSREDDRVGQRRFLDLNELAPGSGFDDRPNALVKHNDGKSE